VTKSPQTCVLLVAAVALLMTVPYVGAYAKTYSKGCGKNAILMHLNQVKTENQVLRLKLDSLKRPERIEKFASSHGMERSKTMAYVETAGQANVAENTGAAD
jgi:cell division protein FtsL